MRTTTVVIELSQDEAGTYLAKATRDDDQVALVESTESLYEASAYAVAQITADIVPTRRCQPRALTGRHAQSKPSASTAASRSSMSRSTTPTAST